ncbi:MAG: hypothetical protein C5B51_14515 [Terriglobia bacterium]|nr:MAG: hypothetical protein C5B51_14515 [Terriglobia bacterium]
MNVWICTTLIIAAGAIGGFVNALLSSNGFALPRRIEGIWCPGALSTILIGAFAAFASWAFYGSGADFDVADANAIVHLRFSAVAGAFLVGVVGAKWITNEADKGLLKESVKVAAGKEISKEDAPAIASGTALEVFHKVKQA